jgi:ArsR family transcriptional regulator
MTPEPGSGQDEGDGEQAETGQQEGCCPVATHSLTEHDVEIDVRTFSAMANETRYDVLRLLARADQGVCACELVPQVDVNQSTTSRALGSLYQAGLVDRRKEGRWRYYTTTERAETILTAIDTYREDVA